MGLDMYAYKVPKKFAKNDVEINRLFFKQEDGDQELMYWRKHQDLHDWMELLYRKKGGEGEFNCEVVRLTYEDLEDLRKAIENDELPHSGYGWYGDFDRKSQDLAFVESAEQAIRDGYEVYYDSWW